MLEKKTIFIIPGYRHIPTSKAYKTIASMLEDEGYNPILVTIPWKNTTISENTEYFLQQYKKVQTKRKYILGFSFGAMIAFLASTKVDVSGLILCSLSPYFKEDISKIKKSESSKIQAKRYQDFSTLHCGRLAKQIKAEQILLLYGVKEASPLKKRVNYAFDKISSKKKYLIPIKKTEHDIGDKKYLSTIHQVARGLN